MAGPRKGNTGAGLLKVEEGPQLFGTGRVAQLAQGLGFDLADALAGDVASDPSSPRSSKEQRSGESPRPRYSLRRTGP